MSLIMASPPVRTAKVAIAVTIAKKAGAVKNQLSTDWRAYPFDLVPGDPQLRFPAAEGNHPGHESDTWFIAGELTAQSGRQFAFLTIFNKNRPGLGDIVCRLLPEKKNDLDNGEYGTCTDYDMPPANMKPGATPKMTFVDGHVDVTYRVDAGTAVLRTCLDEQGQLLPYTYDVALVGTDQAGQAMRLELHVTPSRAPVPLGAAAYNGRIDCFGQP